MRDLIFSRYRIRLGIIVVTFAAAVVVVGVTIMPALLQQQQHTVNGAFATNGRPHVTGADWPGYLFDAQNTNYNAQEKTLSPSTMSQLALLGEYTVGAAIPFKDAITTSVVAVGSTLFFGSWDGNEYAVDAYSYQLRWKQFLGIDRPPEAQQCSPLSAGVSSNGLWDHGILYAGGGDGKMYALNATTGAVIWKTTIATPPNEYLWGSPVIGNAHLYIGIASFGDCPLIRGRIDMLDPASGTLQAIHNTVSANGLGNSLWNKAALASTLGQVVYATGNGPTADPESQAIVSIDWNTLKNTPNGTWQPPVAQLGIDPDFGSSCMIVPIGSTSQPEAICHNKNAYLYAVQFAANGLQLKWSLKLGVGGDAPGEGLGDISAGSFDGHYAYYATGSSVLNGVTSSSAVYAINPTTGAVVWRTGLTDGFPLTALPGANGFLVIGLTNTGNRGSFVILSTQDGTILYEHPVSMAVYGSPSIANGQIFVPTVDGHVYIFGLADPLSADETFSGTTLPPQWIWVNANAKHQHLTGTSLAIDAAGKYEVDNMNLLTQGTPTGDFTLTASVNFTPTLFNEQAVVTAYEGPGNYIKVALINKAPGKDQFELTAYVQGKAVITYQVDDHAARGTPVSLQIVHLGSVYYGYASIDGTKWLDLGSYKPPFIATLVGINAFATDNSAYETAQFYSCVLRSI